MSNYINELNYYTQKIDTKVITPHFHSGYEMIYVKNGRVNIEINNVLYTVVAPSIVLLNPFEWHKIISADNEYVRYALVIDSSIEHEISPYLLAMIKCRPSGFNRFVSFDKSAVGYIDFIFELLTKEVAENAKYKDRLIFNEIHNLLIMIYRYNDNSSKPQSELMMKIQKYIDDNYATIENTKQLADIFYISYGHLSRAFKKHSGYSPIEYLVNTRLYNAQLLLVNTREQIVKICSKVGFFDINNFSRQFKRNFGVSPSVFRAENSK